MWRLSLCVSVFFSRGLSLQRWIRSHSHSEHNDFMQHYNPISANTTSKRKRNKMWNLNSLVFTGRQRLHFSLGALKKERPRRTTNRNKRSAAAGWNESFLLRFVSRERRLTDPWPLMSNTRKKSHLRWWNPASFPLAHMIFSVFCRISVSCSAVYIGSCLPRQRPKFH